VVCASLPVFEVKQPETLVREVAVDSRVTSSEVKEPIAIETPRVDKSEISQLEAPRINKPEISQLETPCINKPEIAQTEASRIEKSEYTQVKEFEKPVKDVAVASRVTPFEAKETIAPETSCVDKSEISQLEAPRINKSEISQTEAPRTNKLEIAETEAPRIEKPEYTQVKEFETSVKDVAVASRVTSSETKETLSIETPRINKPEIAQTEAPRIEKPDHSQLKEIEKPVKDVLATSLAPADEKPEVTFVDIASARVSQNTVVQTPESAVVSRLVETVVETLAVTPTLSSTGEGEIHIKLKSDILDGSSIKIEVKNGELKVVVEPASRAAEEIFLKSQEAFQNHLAERVTAWRINVGVAVLDLRNNLKRKLEELS
jgi:hypothetical protein